jgi:hypothetical protein
MQCGDPVMPDFEFSAPEVEQAFFDALRRSVRAEEIPRICDQIAGDLVQVQMATVPGNSRCCILTLSENPKKNISHSLVVGFRDGTTDCGARTVPLITQATHYGDGANGYALRRARLVQSDLLDQFRCIDTENMGALQQGITAACAALDLAQKQIAECPASKPEVRLRFRSIGKIVRDVHDGKTNFAEANMQILSLLNALSCNEPIGGVRFVA